MKNKNKKINVKTFFSYITSAAHIGSINLSEIKESYFNDICIGLCKVHGWRTKNFDFTKEEFYLFIKSQGVKLI